MEELGIILTVVFCVLTLGLGVLLGFYIRAVLLNSRRQTPVQFLVKITLSGEGAPKNRCKICRTL